MENENPQKSKSIQIEPYLKKHLDPEEKIEELNKEDEIEIKTKTEERSEEENLSGEKSETTPIKGCKNL